MRNLLFQITDSWDIFYLFANAIILERPLKKQNKDTSPQGKLSQLPLLGLPCISTLTNQTWNKPTNFEQK